jgi:hypothetical protein
MDSPNVLSRGLNSWKLVAEDMMAGDDAFLKLNKDLVGIVLIYVEVKVARAREEGEKKQEDRGRRTGFM